MGHKSSGWPISVAAACVPVPQIELIIFFEGLAFFFGVERGAPP